MNAAVLAVPGAAADVGSMVDIPAVVAGLTAVDIVPTVDISEMLVDMAVEPPQVVEMVKFLNRVHNLYSSSLALNSGHNRGSA